MPTSCIISTKKKKTNRQILSDQVDELVTASKKQLDIHEQIKKDTEYNPEYFKQALEIDLKNHKDKTETILNEEKCWLNELKMEIKSAVLAKKKYLKSLMINPFNKDKVSKKSTQKRRRAGKFI